MIYSMLTADKVAAVYKLTMFLQRLRIIGHLAAHTEQAQVMNCNFDAVSGMYEIMDLTGADYSIVKDYYDPIKGQHIKSIEMLEDIFGRISETALRGTL